jgi:hypothetical protein
MASVFQSLSFSIFPWIEGEKDTSKKLGYSNILLPGLDTSNTGYDRERCSKSCESLAWVFNVHLHMSRCEWCSVTKPKHL